MRTFSHSASLLGSSSCDICFGVSAISSILGSVLLDLPKKNVRRGTEEVPRGATITRAVVLLEPVVTNRVDLSGTTRPKPKEMIECRIADAKARLIRQQFFSQS